MADTGTGTDRSISLLSIVSVSSGSVERGGGMGSGGVVNKRER